MKNISCSPASSFLSPRVRETLHARNPGSRGASTKGQRGGGYSARAWLVVHWRPLAVAVGQASHPEREESGDPRTGCKPPFHSPPQNPSVILWLRYSHPPCGNQGWRCFSDSQAHPCLSSARDFLWLPGVLLESAHIGHKAGLQPPVVQLSSELFLERVTLRTYR